MDYPIINPPYGDVPVAERNKKQVEAYFKWFLQEREERIRILENYVNNHAIQLIRLDKTRESLIPLWEWFEGEMAWEPYTEEELKKIHSERPEWAKPYAAKDHLTLKTMAIGADIAVYFGETLIALHPSIYWGYLMKPKLLMGVKLPMLMGQTQGVESYPVNLISVLMVKSRKEKDSKRLYEAFLRKEKAV